MLKIIGIIASTILVLYFVAKIFFINIYIKPNLKNYNIKVKDLGIVKKTIVSDYYTFDNLKLKNDFKEYKIIKEIEYDKETKKKCCTKE